DPAGLPGLVSAHFGQITFRGQTGEFDLFVGGGGSFEVSAPGFPLPLDARSPVTFRAPFTMRGSLSTEADPLGGTLANFGFDLSGTGTGTAFFVPRDFVPGLGQEFVFDRAVFDFKATPEPATVVLLGLGLLGVQARRRAGPLRVGSRASRPW